MSKSDLIIPVGDNVVLGLRSDSKVGAIFIPEAARERQYIVVAVGKEVDLSVGQRVIPDIEKLKVATINGSKFFVTKYTDLLVIVKNKSEKE